MARNRTSLEERQKELRERVGERRVPARVKLDKWLRGIPVGEQFSHEVLVWFAGKSRIRGDLLCRWLREQMREGRIGGIMFRRYTRVRKRRVSAPSRVARLPGVSVKENGGYGT
jgi:hypothetical protein